MTLPDFFYHVLFTGIIGYGIVSSANGAAFKAQRLMAATGIASAIAYETDKACLPESLPAKTAKGQEDMSGKKAEQRKIKEVKQAAAKRKDVFTGKFIKGGLALLAVLALAMFFQGLFLGPQTLTPEQIDDTDHVRGNPEAPLTLTVYADFQCPACLTETDLIARAWPQISDKVRLVFRHYPLDIHRHAFLAARYAEAAARQDAFWPMHDVLYGNQALWSNVADATEIFDGYGEQLGLDLARLKADVELPEIRAKILADQRGGTRAGVRATPTLYLNGRLVSNPRTATELVELVSRTAE